MENFMKNYFYQLPAEWQMGIFVAVIMLFVLIIVGVVFGALYFILLKISELLLFILVNLKEKFHR